MAQLLIVRSNTNIKTQGKRQFSRTANSWFSKKEISLLWWKMFNNETKLLQVQEFLLEI